MAGIPLCDWLSDPGLRHVTRACTCQAVTGQCVRERIDTVSCNTHIQTLPLVNPELYRTHGHARDIPAMWAAVTERYEAFLTEKNLLTDCLAELERRTGVQRQYIASGTDSDNGHTHTHRGNFNFLNHTFTWLAHAHTVYFIPERHGNKLLSIYSYLLMSVEQVTSVSGNKECFSRSLN